MENQKVVWPSSGHGSNVAVTKRFCELKGITTVELGTLIQWERTTGKSAKGKESKILGRKVVASLI